MAKIKAYTDGSCYHKTKKGGLGVYLTDGTNEWYISEGYAPTTISRMEGIAIIRALEFFQPKLKIDLTIISDSEFIIKAFNLGWLSKWNFTDFQGIKNKDIWKKIIVLLRERKHWEIQFKHIRGHQKDIQDFDVFGNNIADILADYKNFKNFKKDL